MADINYLSSEFDTQPPDSTRFIELLFFAYRDFVGDPDTILQQYDFGRAHHRVLHFVARNPGISVAELLHILQITKQSLARVLKQLIDTGFIRQEQGEADRRQRLLFVTEDGLALFESLREPQSRRINKAMEKLNPQERQLVARFLSELINPESRLLAQRIMQKQDES